MSFSTLVLIDEDTATNLAQFVANANGGEAFKTSCDKLIKEQKGVELVTAIIANSGAVFEMEDSNAIEGCFRAIISVILRYGEDNGAKNLQDLVTLLCSNKNDDKVRLRLKLLLTIFNLVSNDTNKYSTVMAIFQYALDTKQAADVAAFHNRVVKWCNDWSKSGAITLEQTRSLYLLVRNVLVATPNHATSEEARNYFLHYLQTFDSNTALPASATGAATVDAIVEYCKTPVDRFDERSSLLRSLSAAQVAGNDVLSKLRALLVAVCDGTYTDYQAYASNSANKAVMTQYSIDSEQLETNMRVLAVCSLAATNEKLTYEELASGLGCDIDEVEIWIVESIAANVLEAAIDQISKVVTITRCSYRNFSTKEWKTVQNRLKALRESIASVYTNMQEHVTASN
jgi:translation initiation factor 3 subunit M